MSRSTNHLFANCCRVAARRDSRGALDSSTSADHGVYIRRSVLENGILPVGRLGSCSGRRIRLLSKRHDRSRVDLLACLWISLG